MSGVTRFTVNGPKAVAIVREGDETATVKVVAGSTIRYGYTPKVTATSYAGSITVGNELDFTRNVWIVSTDKSEVQVTLEDTVQGTPLDSVANRSDVGIVRSSRRSALAQLPNYVATKFTDLSIEADGDIVESAGGGFTSAMEGQSIHLRRAGQRRVSGTYAWEPEPVIATVTDVLSSTQAQISVAATTEITSGGVASIGPDATTALNNALHAGLLRLPDVPFNVAGQVFTTAAGQRIEGVAGYLSELYSITRKGNGPVAAFHDHVVFRDFTWFGSGWGSQPTNTEPDPGDYEALIEFLANSGCGATFARVKHGLMDVVAYQCGGEGLSAFSAANSGDVFTMNNHGYVNGDAVKFRTLSSGSAGVSLGTTYYVISATTNTFQVATAPGGSAVPLSADITGTMGNETHNGIAGLYSTLANIGCTFRGAAYYCRGGVNEDNFFNGSNVEDYLPAGNVYETIRTWWCKYGHGMEPGRQVNGNDGPRGMRIHNGDARYCVGPGAELRGAFAFTIDGFYGEANQYGVSILGDHEEKRSTGGTGRGLKLIKNVEHGLRLGTFTDNNDIEAYCAYNGYSGLGISGGASAASRPKDNDIKVTVRQNNQTGTSPEVDLSYATRNRITVLQDVLPGEFDESSQVVTPTPMAPYIVREQNSSDYNLITDESRITAAGTTGTVLLIGANSRNGTVAKRTRIRTAAENLRGETFPRLEAVGTTAPAGGDARATLTGFLAGDKVTALYCQTSASSTGLTGAYLCLWSSTGALLAITANMATTFNGGSGVLGANLASAYEFTTDAAAYLGFTFIGGTPPNLLRANTNSSGQVASGLVPHIAMTGQSSAPDPHNLSAGSTAYWVG